MICWLKNSAIYCLTAVFFAACSPSGGNVANMRNIRVELSRDSSSLLISGLDHGLFESLATDSGAATAWKTLVPVFKESANEDMKGLEPVYPGKYLATADRLLFTPDTAFKKGSTYRAELNIPDSFTKEEINGRDQPPGNPKMKEFRFVFH